MYTETDGIVLKKLKLTNGKTLLTVFTQKFGKISAGTGINEKNRNKSSMAVRPFSFSRFEMFKNIGNYNIVSGELLESYYKIGEDIDKYVEAAYILEYTDRILVDDSPSPQIYSLLLDYLKLISARKGDYQTLTIAYQLKTLKYLGIAPAIKECASCSSKDCFRVDGKETELYFSIECGGLLCKECTERVKKEQDSNIIAKKTDKNEDEILIYPINFDMIRVVAYILDNPLKALDKVKLVKTIETDLRRILRRYLKYHLDIEKLKSESFCWID